MTDTDQLEPPPVQKRICKACHRSKPETPKHFQVQAHHGTPRKIYRSICRDCKRENKGLAVTDPQPKERVCTESKKICSICHNMSWCRPKSGPCKCGRAYALEAKVELVFHRHFERAV